MREFFFLPGTVGALCALHWAGERVLPPILLLPPWQEEMNKSRHQLNQMAQRLNALGRGVLLVDWFGTGDSEGDWREATLSQWRLDVADALSYLEERYTKTPSLLALRAGTLLIPDHYTGEVACAFPLTSGDSVLTQWLRQKLFADKLEGRKSTRESLLHTWQQDYLELAGYSNNAQFLAELQSARIATPQSTRPPLLLDHSPSDEPTPVIAALKTQWNAQYKGLQGSAFWQANAIETHDQLSSAVERWCE